MPGLTPGSVGSQPPGCLSTQQCVSLSVHTPYKAFTFVGDENSWWQMHSGDYAGRPCFRKSTGAEKRHQRSAEVLKSRPHVLLGNDPNPSHRLAFPTCSNEHKQPLPPTPTHSSIQQLPQRQVQREPRQDCGGSRWAHNLQEVVTVLFLPSE